MAPVEYGINMQIVIRRPQLPSYTFNGKALIWALTAVPYVRMLRICEWLSYEEWWAEWWADHWPHEQMHTNRWVARGWIRLPAHMTVAEYLVWHNDGLPTDTVFSHYGFVEED